MVIVSIGAFLLVQNGIEKQMLQEDELNDINPILSLALCRPIMVYMSKFPLGIPGDEIPVEPFFAP